MMRCPQCERVSVEWNRHYRAYACLWLDCLWMSQNPPEAQGTRRAQELKESTPRDVQPRPAQA